MSLFIVDASVGIKWFVPEHDALAALRLQNPAYRLHAPGYFDVEFANIVWKKRRRGELTRAEADVILAHLPGLPLTRHFQPSLISEGFDIADQTQRTVYDCLYLALAVQLNGRMVTADDRLVNSLAGTAWAHSVIRLADVP